MKETKTITHFGGNSDVEVSTTVAAAGVSIVDIEDGGGGSGGVSPMLLSSLSSPPSDELSCVAPFVPRFTGGLIFARRGRSLPEKN